MKHTVKKISSDPTPEWYLMQDGDSVTLNVEFEGSHQCVGRFGKDGFQRFMLSPQAAARMDIPLSKTGGIHVDGESRK